MGDHELWRKNIPEDFQGKMGENWDDDVLMGPIFWSAVGIAGSVTVAFILCWYLIPALAYFDDEPALSPLAEANARRLPPTPWLQPSPEVEMDDLLEQSAEHLASYGWNDQGNGVVHIPVERAMDLMAASFPEIQDVPAEVVDSVADGAAEVEPEHGETGAEETSHDEPAHPEADHGSDSGESAGGEAHG